MPTTFGLAAPVSVTATGLRARGARPAAGAGTTPSGTSRGIPAGRSWGRPTSAGRRARHQRRAHRSPVARMRASGPRARGGAELAPVARGVRADRVALPGRVALRDRVALPGRVAEGAHRPAARHGRRVRRAKGNRNAGDGTRAPGRHRAQVGRRLPASAVAAASLARAAPARSTTWGPVAPAGSWAMLRAAAYSRRGVLSPLLDDRCGTPTSGRPTGAAEPTIVAEIRCSPWVTPSMSRR
jgi:hypothetical protein